MSWTAFGCAAGQHLLAGARAEGDAVRVNVEALIAQRIDDELRRNGRLTLLRPNALPLIAWPIGGLRVGMAAASSTGRLGANRRSDAHETLPSKAGAMKGHAGRSSFLLRRRVNDGLGLRIEWVELRGGCVRRFGSLAAMLSFLKRSHPQGLK